MISKEIDTFFRWLQIREDHGYPRLTTLAQLRADADHSSLLKRLLAGEEPLPEPPPLAFSYPWCELIEKGQERPFEVYESGFDPDILIVDQGAWVILDRPGDRSWIVTYKVPDVERIRRASDREFTNIKVGPEYLKLSESRWRVYSTTPAPQDPTWVIERTSSDTPPVV